jgi:methylenetetrahydrofolate dehydrogenase (NAD+)
LNDVLKVSDTVITGVPFEGYQLPSESLKDGVILVNFSTYKNIGPDAQAKCSVFVPSVGKVTIAMLQRNLIRLFNYQQ